MLSGADLAEVKAEMTWLAGALDAARDLDVFIEDTFRAAAKAPEDRIAYAGLGACLLTARTQAYEQALAALGSQRYADLLLKAAAWLEIGAWTSAEEPEFRSLRERQAAAFASQRLDRMRRRVLKHGRMLASLDAPGRHRLRIAAKKLRYAAEFFADCFADRNGRKPHKFLRTLEDFQDRLGQLNDIAVARRLAADLIHGRPAELAFAAGLIVGGRRRDAAAIDEAALQAFARYREAKPFWD
jgi:CHAD domain-containing protein